MKVPLKFRNKKAILIATGPSLTTEVIETIRQYKDDFIIFGCNDSYKVVDFLDIHYACDTAWWRMWGEDLKEKRPNLESWTQCEVSAKDFDLKHIKGKFAKGLSVGSEIIHFGHNSGFQLLNLAFLMGCNKFILAGYNMQAVGGSRHYFGEHPDGLSRTSPYPRFIESFATVQPEIKPLIVNCTPQTALTIFRRNDLEEELRL